MGKERGMGEKLVRNKKKIGLCMTFVFYFYFIYLFIYFLFIYF